MCLEETLIEVRTLYFFVQKTALRVNVIAVILTHKKIGCLPRLQI
jgi:hypothetical protein